MTEKPNWTREKEVRDIMERDTLGLSFWFAVLVMVGVIVWAGVAAGDEPQCQFYECPYGEVVWLENGGVTFKRTNTKDCKLVGRGDEKAAREFEINNKGKHLMIDCKKEKKK